MQRPVELNVVEQLKVVVVIKNNPWDPGSGSGGENSKVETPISA